MSYHGKLTAMSYPAAKSAPRPPGTAPPQWADPWSPMAGRAWPGAGGPGRPIRSGPDADQYWKATGQHPQATDQHSRQPASTQGNRAALAATGRVLSGLGPGFVIFIFLLARRQAWGLPRSRGVDRPSRRLRLKSLPILGGPDGGSGRTQDPGIPSAQTPEGGRLG
jgi:hypothetical protein